MHLVFALLPLLLPQTVGTKTADVHDGFGGGGSGPPRIGRVTVPGSAVPTATGSRPNVLLVVVDDLGIDMVPAYSVAPSPPCTPHLDDLAAGGVVFRNTWASSICSPARAQLMTGRYGFRTGIGRNVGSGLGSAGLRFEEIALPEQLVGYETAAVGKWHLAALTDSPLHPNLTGFGSFAGSLFNLTHQSGDYDFWEKTSNGSVGFTDRYATNDIVNEAILAANTLQEPWFVYVGLHAPHSPLHSPPATLCNSACAQTYCGQLSATPTEAEYVKAMSESLDTELGRLLANVRAIDPKALIVFVGDNGTLTEAIEPPFPPGRGKGTLYESGIQVPMIIDGPGIAPGVCDALVSIADVFATLAEFAGVPSAAEDSVSLVPYLQDPTRPSLRTLLFSERFAPNGPGPYDFHDVAIRNATYKLIRVEGAPDELYDLTADPFEEFDLIPGLASGSPAEAAYQQLKVELAALLSS